MTAIDGGQDTDGAQRLPVEDPVATENRRRILEAAERLIAVRGIEKVRLRDIAGEAGVSIGKIQHYFETRETLIEEMLSIASTRRVAEWAEFAADIDAPARKMVTLLEHAITDRERCLVWLATVSVASRNSQYLPDITATYSAWRATLVEVIEAGTHSGTFTPSAEVDEVADIIIAAIDGLMTAVAINLPGFDSERTVRILRHVTGLLLSATL